MYKYSLYDEEGYFVTEVIAESPEEAVMLLGVESDIEIVVN